MAQGWRPAAAPEASAIMCAPHPSRPRMPHSNLKLNEPVGDAVKTTTCYMCACRCGRADALTRCKVMHRVRTRAPAQGCAGRRHASGMTRSKRGANDAARQHAHATR